MKLIPEQVQALLNALEIEKEALSSFKNYFSGLKHGDSEAMLNDGSNLFSESQYLLTEKMKTSFADALRQGDRVREIDTTKIELGTKFFLQFLGEEQPELYTLVDTKIVRKGIFMKSLCIKTNDSNVISYLLNELKYSKLENIYFSENQFKHYKNVIIHCLGNDFSSFYSKISSILSFLVIDELEEGFLKHILLQNYFYFNSNEREQILCYCFDIFADNYVSCFDKKFQILYDGFYNFIKENKILYLDGFINFRLKSYFSILDDTINNAVNHFLIEKEYLEFVSLLKIYINTQDYKCEFVHLIYSSSESILLDEDKNIIAPDSNIFNAKYLSDISFSSNDYTLNSLLNLFPKKIYIHLIDNKIDEFVQTLELIFEKRIVLCTDCNICEFYKSSNLNNLMTKMTFPHVPKDSSIKYPKE